MFCRSPVEVNPQSLWFSMLYPAEVMGPAPPQFDGVPELGVSTVLDATIEFCTVIVPLAAPSSRPPPAAFRLPPSLSTIVELTIVVVLVQGVAKHQLKMPPPWPDVFPVIVESITVRLPG